MADNDEFDPRAYWERRLDADWNQQGVGHASLGQNLNKWQYRLRHDRFAQVVSSVGIEPSTSRVLDVGSGTGEYIHAWRSLGADDVTGMDLTDAAVTRLRERFPETTVVRRDITEDVDDFPAGQFDVISCMDVLFHVTDDDRYVSALRNIGRLLRPGGFFVWSDLFLHGRESRGGHIVWRSLKRAEDAVRAADMDVVLREPLFWLLNEPRDTKIPGALTAWKGGMWLVSRNERVADSIGQRLWRLDARLTSHRRESPSTEIMVCRRREVEQG
ncbi:class I SAM-dependent methyltransferase [Nocardioides agariphilus]|uniref:Class I SAM-dependent methyltransferase n=1 Tax=Nocardioides agariphilus TaxID=433664 RepID=A0A930VNW3_9ACTN|nr:class I SAM-dependent methyltransferase [Nocardioides agariphilus]